MPGVSRPKLAALARSFPSLAHAPHLEPFDPDGFAAWLKRGQSDGTRHAGAFVLHVFNWMNAQPGLAFDLGAAINRWDSAHVAAFSAWAAAPWYA